MQLRVHEHLAAQSLSDLEATVPDELLGSVWPRVQAGIAARDPARRSDPMRWQGWNRLVPVLAAATLLLLVGSGLLYREVRQLHQREMDLVQRIVRQDRRLAELDIRTSMDPVARAARLAGRAVWERALERHNSLSVSELEAMLRNAPTNATLFTASELEVVANSIPVWSATALETALSTIESDDGIQAGELLRLIEALDINPEKRISTSRILAISRGAARRGRS
jgi:hypothetical protein